MSAPDARLGYTEVDDQPDSEMILTAMDATAAWPAVRRLRAWEREHLAVHPDSRVLDVGCGLGDVAISLAHEIGSAGRVVGVDASTAMLDIARHRAAEAGVDVDFHTADATHLDEPVATFDACRSERMLQWLTDPAAAVAEMVRVLRPGGRLTIIDTDWRTLLFDLPDHESTAAVHDAILAFRGGQAAVGSRLLNLCRDAGVIHLDHTAATHVWTHWDPDTEPAPAGVWPLAPVVEQMVEAGLLDAEPAKRFVADLLHAARNDRFFMSLGMFAVTGLKPAE
jgi:SAM-dependent methyltransferase